MDNCFVDVTVEFLSVAFHNILYHTSVYPASVFERRRKYDIVVHYSRHPEINQYIDMCLKSVIECMKSGQLHRVELIIINSEWKPLLSFVFDFDKTEFYDDTSDAYLIKSEQNMRAFCLKLATINHRFPNLPEDSSFMIYLHTSESVAVALATNPALEEFPLIETEECPEECDNIMPIKRFSVRQYDIDTYIEIK